MTGLADGLHPVPPGKLACVVTYLAMTRPPAPAGHADASAPRLDRVTDMPPERYRALFRRVGGPWLWTSRLRLPEDALRAILHHPAVELWVLPQDGEDAGFVELDFRVDGACEIAFLGLAPGLTRRGLGAGLLNHALRRAWAQPIERLSVHTCTLDHPAALGLYMSRGFVPVVSAVEVTDDPRCTGTLDAAAAPQVPRL